MADFAEIVFLQMAPGLFYCWWKIHYMKVHVLMQLPN